MTKIKNRIDVAIIGGGLIGMLTAYALNKKGLSVSIFEKGRTASESSWAGGGILSPLYPWLYPDAVNVLAHHSQQVYADLANEFRAQSDIDPEYVRCGMYVLKEDLSSNAYDWLKKNNCSHVFRKPDCSQNFSKDFLYLPDIAQIRNPRFIKSVKAAIDKTAIQIHFNTSVVNFSKNEGGIFNLATQDQNWEAEKIIVCAGAWTSQILGDLGNNVEIKPIRGQMLLYKASASLLSSIILAKGKYIIPRLDGRILVGSTMENVGFDKQTTAHAYEEIKAFVSAYFPDLSKFPIERHWSGLRPSTPHGVPYICEHPSIPSLFINSGHFRNGVVMAPASATLMADLVCGDKPSIDPEPYSFAL